MLTVTITDDGRGADSGSASGSGLAALRARVETAGGHLIATGGAAGGFQVSAHIPLAGPR
jgi:signal transduction histidine kinase